MEKTKSRNCQFQFKSKFALVKVISEGLLYNPINMKIEDKERLY